MYKYSQLFLLGLLVVVGSIGKLYASSSNEDHRTEKQRLDSLENTLPFLEQKVLSTLMFGGSAPVQFSGEVRLKGQYHRFLQYPDYLGPHLIDETPVSGDRSYLQTSWEESMLRFGLVAKPGRNTVLWSRFGFYNTFPGNRVSTYYINNDFSPSQYKHSAKGWPVNLFEDMCAGIAVRTLPASFQFMLGNIIWTEASPLTVWKAQPRIFAWEYLPYEMEDPVSAYYENNVAKGEQIGRAAWHKKAFNGINLESIRLPLDFHFNTVYGKFGEYDKFEREGMDFATDLGYAADTLTEIVETGYGDSYRHIFHTRFSKKMKNLELGLNYNNIHVSEDIIYAQNPSGIFFNTMFDLEFRPQGGIFHGPNWAAESEYHLRDSLTGKVDTVIASSMPFIVGPGQKVDSLPLDCGRGFYKESQTFSIDLRGNITPRFQILADIGICKVDTNWVYGDTVDTRMSKYAPITVKKRKTTSTDFLPAVYTNLRYEGKLIVESDLAYISKGFYSPFSLACPMDAFFAFGSNLVGAGTFIGPSEQSPYFQNTAGAWLSVAPKLKGYGHLRAKYGQHFQLEKGRDLLYFPYRLTGMDINSILQSTYSKWGSGTIDFPASNVKYDRRLGDESYDPTLGVDGAPKLGDAAHVDEGPEKGGLRADYLSLFEGFVAYNDPIQLAMNYMSTTGKIQRDRTFTFGIGDTLKFIADPKTLSKFNSIDATSMGTLTDTSGSTDTLKVYATRDSVYTSESGFVPMHKKYSFNFEIDGSYDISPFIHYKRDFFLGGFLGISGVSTSFTPFAVNDEADDMLLWSLFFRFEPAVAITKKFYLLGMVGYETWRSEKAWMNVDRDPETDEEAGPVFKLSPINYKDLALGIGFDWDMIDRVSLHTRYKWMHHTDEAHSLNNMKWFLLSSEIVMFF